MLNKKRAFVSLGASVLIFIAGSFSLLFTYRLLKSPQWLSTLMVWILVWPTRLIKRIVTIQYSRVVAVAVALSVGILCDIAILSVLFYAVLSRFKSRPLPSSPPSPPLSFK
jgi:hypothetical protein